MAAMGVALPPSCSEQRDRADARPTCARTREARGKWPPGELSFSLPRTREFEHDPLQLLLACATYGPVFTSGSCTCRSCSRSVRRRTTT